MDFKHTNLAEEHNYPKLVRDKIPEIIEKNDGVRPETRMLEDDEEFLAYLLKKVVEEAKELQHAPAEGNVEEELADLLELVETVATLKGKKMEDIVAFQKEKRAKRGGFKKRILILRR